MRFYNVPVIRILEHCSSTESMLPESRSQTEELRSGANESSVLYPVQVNLADYNILDTHYGRFGARLPGRVYMWPLLWTNSYTGK